MADQQGTLDLFFTLSEAEEGFLSSLRITGDAHFAAEYNGFDADQADVLLEDTRIAITIRNEYENLGKFVRLFGWPAPTLAEGSNVVVLRR